MSDATELMIADLGMPSGVSLRNPETVLAEAGERAKALANMVERTKSYTQIGQGKHLRVEAWITCANFYGCSGSIKETEAISIDGVTGFKARAQVKHDASGTVLAEADAICMRDEDNWDKKPLHQVMSMAQTRALSKALAAKFRWVVVLGGFAPTPAEEMTGHEHDDKPKAQQKKSATTLLPNYGRNHCKGKPVNDPEVTDEDLSWYETSMTNNLNKEGREKFKAQNEAIIAGIQEELKRREQARRAASSAESTDASEPVMFNEAAWKAVCLEFSEQHAALYKKVKEEFKVADGSKVKPEQRGDFFARMQDCINDSNA